MLSNMDISGVLSCGFRSESIINSLKSATFCRICKIHHVVTPTDEVFACATCDSEMPKSASSHHLDAHCTVNKAKISNEHIQPGRSWFQAEDSWSNNAVVVVEPQVGPFVEIVVPEMEKLLLAWQTARDDCDFDEKTKIAQEICLEKKYEHVIEDDDEAILCNICHEEGGERHTDHERDEWVFTTMFVVQGAPVHSHCLSFETLSE